MDTKFEDVCFIICPIGSEGSEARKNSDSVLKHIITPVLKETGYKPIRADHIDDLGIITTQIVHYILKSPLVIADLTFKNPNVFYELAIRHMVKKPVILIRKIGESIPFDISSSRVIDYELDLDHADKAKQIIKKAIIAIKESGDLDYGNPISMAVDILNLKSSDNPEKKSLGEIIDIVSELRYGMSKIERRLSKIDYDAAKDYVDDYIKDVNKNLVQDIKEIVGNMVHNVKRSGINDDTIQRFQDKITRLEGKIEIYLKDDEKI